MNIRKVIISLVLFSIVIGGAIFFAKFLANLKNPPAPKISTKPKEYVKALWATYGEKDHKVKTFGRVISSHAVTLSSEVSGKLIEASVPLKKGASFKKGDILFRIDNTTAFLNLQSRKSNFVNSVSSMLADIKIDYPENFDSWANFLNQLDIKKTLPPLPETKSGQEKTFVSSQGIFSDYYSIKSEENQLSKYTVRAPFNGSIADVSAQPGAIINMGSSVVKLIDTYNMEVEIPLIPQEAAGLYKGAYVTLKKEDLEVKAKVVRIADYLDAGSQSINVYAAFTNSKDLALYEGDYVETIITKNNNMEAMVAPRSALVDGTKIYTIEKDSSLVLKNITVKGMGENTFFFTGLKDSTLVVTEPLTSDYISKKVIPILP